MDATLPFLILYACLSALLFSGMQSMACYLTDLRARYSGQVFWFYQVCNPDGLADALWGAIIGYGTFAVIYWGYRILRHKEGLGYGDVKFLAALGAWHTWTFLPRLVFLAASFACGAVVIGLLMRGKESLKNPLPFGPFLAAAGFVVGWDSLLAGR